MLVVIGYWVMGIVACHELCQWGEDGGTETPFTDKSEAGKQAEYLAELHPKDTFFILTLHNTGQMLSEEWSKH